MLPPRPATSISGGIAPGVVTSGGRFGPGPAMVSSGGRVTLRFATSEALGRAKLEVWARSRNGAYHFVTSRIADSAGVVRYYSPPITVWTAFEAKFAGDFEHGPGVSPGRVVTVR